jgi:predicted permease
MTENWRDIRQAWRSLRRSPGFLVTSVGTLALAIGVVVAMFSVVNTVMLQPLPFPNHDRLVLLQGTAPGSDLPQQFGLGNEFYVHFKEHATLLDGVFTFQGGTSTFRANDRVERIGMAWPTNDMYSTLGVRPQLGRLPRAEDEDNVVLISYRLWDTWFGRDSAVIGKWFFVSDSMKQVVGVMPPEFQFPSDQTMLWVSGEVNATQVNPGSLGAQVVARLKPGATTEGLTSELHRLAGQLPDRFGGTPPYRKLISQFRPVVTPLLDATVGPTLSTSLLILLGSVVVVLLIACANVANLFLVRGETRRRDLTIRRAFGATRAQLMRLQMAEVIVVASLAGILAVGLAIVGLPLFLQAAPDGVPRLSEARMNLPTIGATFLLVLLAAAVCGIVPALRASSAALGHLREGSRGSIGGRQWGRSVLVVAQTALALVLLIGSSLLLQSFNRLRNVDPGYDIRDIYTFQFAPQQPQLNDGPSLGRMHLAMMDRLRALPGVSAVGVVNNIPLDEGTGLGRVLPEGASSDADGVALSFTFTGGDYFEALGIKLVEGRAFTPDEAVAPNRNVIVSRSAAEKLWPGERPLGRRLRPVFGGSDTIAFTVVGVVNDVKQNDWREAGQSLVYFPLTGPTPQMWGMGSPAYVVKSSRADMLTNEVRALVREIAPEAPVYREFTMEFLARRSMLQLSFTTLTLGVLTVLAVILGAVGLYGTLSYVVAQRTREIGVRMALGATAGVVRRQVVSQGLSLVLAGTVLGVVASFLVTRYLSTLLYDVRPVDVLAFATMSVMMIGVGILASYMPAHRASSLDPMEALRSD